MTDHAKQLAEESGFALDEPLKNIAANRIWAKCLSLMAENERLPQSMRLLAEAHAAFCDMTTMKGDTRWMLEAEILLSGGTLPKQGLSCGELKKLLPRFSSEQALEQAREGKKYER